MELAPDEGVLQPVIVRIGKRRYRNCNATAGVSGPMLGEEHGSADWADELAEGLEETGRGFRVSRH